MSLFEYLAIAFGLVFTLAAMRLVGGLPSAIDNSRRYWVHLTLVLCLLLGVIASFWTFWSLRDVEWRFTGFLVALAIPGLGYYMAATIVPADPSEVESWRDHYYAARVRFYVGLGLWTVATLASSIVNLDLPWLHPAQFLRGCFLAVAVTGTITSNPKVHGALVIIVSVVSAVFAFTLGMQPGGVISTTP